jgi:hypothetical protein
MNNLALRGLLLTIVVILSSCVSRRLPPAYRGPEYVKLNSEEVTPKSESEMMSGIKSIAILPFVDATNGVDNTLNNGDLVTIGERFAGHLVGSSTFSSIMYPQQSLEKLIETPYSVNRKDDLKEIGNLLNADAILFGKINQYRMYYPPQLSISMKFYLTRLERFATSNEISSLAHSGVPLNQYNPTFFKQLWDTSAYYDGSNKLVLEKLKHYGKTHSSSFYGWTSDRALRTKVDFFNFIAYDLSNSLNGNKKTEELKMPGKNGKRVKKGRPVHLPSGYYHR